MIIQSGAVYQEDGFKELDITITGDRISALNEAVETDIVRIDAGDMFVIPGLIDIHSHGCVGYDYSDPSPASLDAMLSYQAKNGVLGVLPTIMTLPEESMKSACEIIGQSKNPHVLGINLEGPLLSPQNAGAQNPAHMRAPDVKMFHRLNRVEVHHAKRFT